jgi:N-acetylmuramoyl-L-alanine amidase
MRIVLLRKKILWPLLAFAGLLTLSLLLRVPVQTAFSGGKAAGTIVVIDAGHGGEDGGAVSGSGVPESGINLNIALSLREVLSFCGQRTVMTRTDEGALSSDDAASLREKKVSDLKNRVALVEATPQARLISIHQNSIPGHAAVHGAQVFYNAVAGGDQIADAMQNLLNETVNTGAPRQCKQISDTIYLMKNVTCPAVLVECGFLSNRAEAELLQNNTYQKKLAAVIAAGYLNTEYK